MSLTAEQIVANARTLTLNCAEGIVRWGYHRAITLTGCVVVRDQGQWSVVGTIREIDQFKAAQAPLTFTVPGRSWQWTMSDLEITDGSLRASLGPKG